MNIALSYCGFARSLDEANAIVNVFDDRISQNNIGEVKVPYPQPTSTIVPKTFFKSSHFIISGILNRLFQ